MYGKFVTSPTENIIISLDVKPDTVRVVAKQSSSGIEVTICTITKKTYGNFMVILGENISLAEVKEVKEVSEVQE